jgi:hypothetical protein
MVLVEAEAAIVSCSRIGDVPMTEVPSQAVLQKAVSQVFELQDDHGMVAEVQLLSVDEGVRMAQDYTCYAAVFALPPGMAASQGTYRVSRAADAWSLFMVPIRPDVSGRALLEAVVHYRSGSEGAGI